jgi:hypothetical protein
MGFEAIANTGDSVGNQQVSQAGAAKASVALCPSITADADLTEIVEGWPALPKELRMGIVVMVRGAVTRKLST